MSRILSALGLLSPIQRLYRPDQALTKWIEHTETALMKNNSSCCDARMKCDMPVHGGMRTRVDHSKWIMVTHDLLLRRNGRIN